MKFWYTLFEKLCGTLAGAGTVINMVTDAGDCNTIMNELISWYVQQPFPSTKMDGYAVYKDQIQTIQRVPPVSCIFGLMVQ